MPRVTPEHSEARRQQILEAARACFLRDGFHQTSMQDIQREAGLSAGAIYLYFKSKNEIILGIATELLATLGGLFPEDPAEEGERLSFPVLMRLFLNRIEGLQREQHLFPLVIQVWAEAMRDPSMWASLRSAIADVDLRLQHLLEACKREGLIRPDTDVAALTMVIIGIGQGFIVQRTLLDETAFERYAAGVEALLMNGAGPD